MKTINQTLLLITLLSITACSSTSSHKSKKKISFTAASLKKGGTVVGGVIDQTSSGNFDMVSLAKSLEARLRESRPELSMMKVSELIETLGLESYKRILDEFRLNGNLSSDTMALLREKVSVRYILMAKIVADELDRDRSRKDITNKEEKAKVISEVRRKLTTRFTFYDLRHSEMAWTGLVPTWGKSERVYQVTSKNTEGNNSNVLNVLNQYSDIEMDKRYPFPSSPSRDNLFKQAGRGLTKNIPGV